MQQGYSGDEKILQFSDFISIVIYVDESNDNRKRKKKVCDMQGVVSPSSSFLSEERLLFHRREFIPFVVKTTYLNESDLPCSHPG